MKNAEKQGVVTKIEFTAGGAGNQWTYIDGVKYATWWDTRTKNWTTGDVVSFIAYEAPLWHGGAPISSAHSLSKLST